VNQSATIRIALQASRVAGVLTLTAMVATASLVAWLPAPAWLRMLAVAALGVYGVTLLRSWAQRSTQRAVIAIELGVDRRIVVVERSGRRTDGKVQDDSYVGSALTTIVWRAACARRSRAIAIVPDMLPPEDFRRLRVLLRLGQARSPAATRPARR
jgi:membrane protein implicated in regulation of membrane protease activity